MKSKFAVHKGAAKGGMPEIESQNTKTRNHLNKAPD